MVLSALVPCSSGLIATLLHKILVMGKSMSFIKPDLQTTFDEDLLVFSPLTSYSDNCKCLRVVHAHILPIICLKTTTCSKHHFKVQFLQSV
jgi:hypothetical protein